MSIYLKTTPSLNKQKFTRKSQTLLEEENISRRKSGEKPIEDLRFRKLDKDSVRNKNNMPNYKWNPRGVSTDHIPSLDTGIRLNTTAKNTVMEKVQRGQITGAEADEIIRKSKCLAPAFNKGAIQYIGSTDAAREAGRKI